MSCLATGHLQQTSLPPT